MCISRPKREETERTFTAQDAQVVKLCNFMASFNVMFNWKY